MEVDIWIKRMNILISRNGGSITEDYLDAFRVVSNVELTKEEISNIVFTIRDEKGTCDANVITRDIVKSLQGSNNKVKTCSLSSSNGRNWVIKINVDD